MAIQHFALALIIGFGIGAVLYNLFQVDNVRQIHSSVPCKPINTGKPTPNRPRRSNKRNKRKQQELECIFCAEPFSNGSKKTLMCGHVFHAPCITRWLAQKNECPYRCH